MRWVILALWVIISLFLLLQGSISLTDVYIGMSMILAAEYVAEEDECE